MFCRVDKYDHITPTLKQLHWLPVEYRIKYKICVLAFNALRGNGPQYMSQMLTVRESMHHIQHLDVLTLDLPRTNYRTVGDRAFIVAAPTLWNALPIELRIIKDITVFKRKLKTYYFEKAFD